ncbi:type IV pili methyl-accepting chemotaxis transducer N-terminal domain-containing protein [Ruegeria arenilitoris]|uniref:type IV pili methyl-accepting chemotaxis transducer N-terminal domain-containing protein n=1 Tax=Ruegeria arenilitoris TaxID=1173585 RepID=UPI00147E3EC3|nr:type IV pili methyl-accepting chemotaxis transducer N-terminal domain-containing protein [Ruegeria arenilitoris]
MMLRNVLAIALVLVAPTGVFAQSTDVSADSAAQAANRINIAGRQRMLSQRMAKAACLMAQDISTTTAYDQLTQAHSLFIRSDSALRKGDPEFGLAQEGFSAVLEALEEIDPHWTVYRDIVDVGIENAAIESADLEVLDNASLNVLEFMNAAVYTTAQAYASATPEVPLGLAMTIDVAGRQRMLTQKAVKEACLMRVATDPAVQAARLAETVDLFDHSLVALLEGFPAAGVIPPSNPELSRKLREVSDLWGPVKEILDRAVAQEQLTDRDLAALARKTEPLLRTMNEAVVMYR